MSCTGCSAPLPTGATFCRACGESAPATPDPRGERPTSYRDAAVLFVVVPSLFALYVGAMLLLARFPPQLEALLPIGLSAAVGLPVARALWRGAAWARPVGLLVAAAFAGLMMWIALSIAPVLGYTDDPGWFALDVVFLLVQGAVGAGAAFVLLRKKS